MVINTLLLTFLIINYDKTTFIICTELSDDEELPLIPCELPPTEEQVSNVNLESDKKVPAAVSPNKLWSTDHGQHILYFFIINPVELKKFNLNEDNILSWARKWEHPSYKDIIPKFRLTNDPSKANIRIEISKLA